MASEKKMKTGFNKLAVAISLIIFAAPSYAAGTIIATALLVGASSATITAVAFVINMVIAAVITKAFFSPDQPSGGALSGDSPNPGNRQQLPPATDNKLPVVYGQAWLGGVITDLSISSNNQELYYVMSICEVTNNGSDVITFGDVYWGGKKCIFENSTSANVVSLQDESTGTIDNAVNGKLQIFLYRNGSNTPVRGNQSAISVMQTPGLIYTWDGSKLMTNTAFAIVHISYNSNAGLTGIQQTRFQITNSRFAPGDCFLDYLSNDVYGAAIPLSQIDTASFDALNTYCAGIFAYTNASGVPSAQTRFRFDGVINTDRSIMQNLQDMASSCDCLLKYNEIFGLWGVITQSPTYTIAMALNDSNMVSTIQITPLDIAGSYNVIECKFPDNTNQDAFNSSTFDLAQIDPTLLYPNEPVNKQSVSLPLVNNDVRAQYIATRMLKASREDLQVQVTINFQGIQLEAGDIVTITNANYGWVAKEFRVMKITEDFESNGAVTAKLILTEFTAQIYDDAPITEFQPSPNTGISDPLVFGTIIPPVVASQFQTATIPLIVVNITASSQGIIQYAELWYSAFANPNTSQLIFAGTTEVQSNGTPYNPGSLLPSVSIANLPSGNWYFFSRMVNSLGSSSFSPASSLLQWRPRTFQYTERYLAVAYADNITGTSNFSFSPTNRIYYGLCNQNNVSPPSDPAVYTWYLADPGFGTSIFLGFTNRTSRRFSFATGFAGYAGGSGAFVLTQASIYDPSIWSALPNGKNIIDLDARTGQLIQTGTTSVGTGEIDVVNNADGKIVAALKPFLNFGGAYQKTSAVANLTIDIYGRVVGFETPDEFYYTEQDFIASAGQTVFSVSRSSGYLINNCWVYQNGVLLDTTEFTDTGGSTGTVTLTNPASLNDFISIVSFRSYNSTTGNYNSFTRNVIDVTNVSQIDCTGLFTLNSGYELIFINGTVLNEQDYNIVGQVITDFPATLTGRVVVYQWTSNNLNTPNGNPVNIAFNTIPGQATYLFNYDPLAFNLFQNGVLLKQNTDFTTATGTYTLANTPDTILNILVNQTFARTGAV